MKFIYCLGGVALLTIGLGALWNHPIPGFPIPDLAAIREAIPSAESLASALSTDATTSLVSRCSRSLLIVEGDEGAGSGSIINIKGNPLIVTNVHVLSGNANPRFQLLNAHQVVPETLGIPDDRDICVASQRQVQEGLEACTSVDTEVTIGDDVVVLGNSLGSHVVTEIKGKVVGLGPNLVETDAKFVKGNSGSPIIHVKTGKVIAIATFAVVRKLDDLSRDSQFNQVRRFGYRLDTITKWKFVTPQAFAVESQRVLEIRQRTDDLLTLAKEMLKKGTVTPAQFNPTSWVGMSLGAYDEGLLKRHRVDPVRYGRAAGVLRNNLNDDLAGISTQALLPYHQHEMEDEYKARNILARFFGRVDWQQVQLRN
ncbi:MAG: serine protease [Chthoniobacter sp.]|nr:serine protease [Chthoniobacter sp.]